MNYTTGKMALFDFPTKDETKAMAFYQAVFGWNFVPMAPVYWMIKAGNETIGGLRKETAAEFKLGNSFVPYFTVPSVKEGKMVVEKCGGQLVGDTVAITDGEDGYFQNFSDLDGNILSLWSKKQ